jgi:hypothetical protein
LARALAQLLGLLGQDLHLALDEVGLQLQHFLNVLRPYQLLRELERGGHVSLGKIHCLFSDMPGPLAGGLGLTFERMDGLVGGGNEAVESLLGLLDTFLGKCPHVAGNLKMLGGSHDFLLLWRRIGCYGYEVVRPTAIPQRRKRQSAPVCRAPGRTL